MSDVAIRVERLSKQYRLGTGGRYRTFGDVIMTGVRRVVRRPAAVARPRAGTLWALRDVSFEVRTGEVLGVIGRNGAGKSTLLKVLARITRPTHGRLAIRGRVGALLEVGTGFHRELTGRENVFLNGVILGMHRADIAKKLDEIVAFAEVERFLDTPVKHYSSGMYLRLAFSVAAHLQPEVLFVDEVVAVGDVEFQKRCIGRMERAAGEGKTVVVVSHNMATVKRLCARALLLDKGQVVMDGAVDAVVDRYLSGVRVAEASRVVREEDHVGRTDLLRVTSMRLRDPVIDRFVVYWRQPIRLVFEIDVRVAVTDVTFGASVRALDDFPIFTAHHDDGGQHAAWDFAPGRYAIALTFDNPLRPGRYRIEIGAHRGHYHYGHLFVVEAASFEVLDHGLGADGARIHQPGLVNAASAWEAPVPLSGAPAVSDRDGRARGEAP